MVVIKFFYLKGNLFFVFVVCVMYKIRGWVLVFRVKGMDYEFEIYNG